MSIDSNIVKLAIDTYHGRPEKYSIEQSNEVLRDALIDINGGTELNYKKMLNGRANGLFELIEEIIPNTVVEGLTGNEFFNQFVEFRNVAAGDANIFEVEDNLWYSIAKVAPGVRGLRRQRLSGVSQTTIHTEMNGVRIYEPLRMLLAKRIDFNQFINKVAESYQQNILNDIYACWYGLTSDQMGAAYFPAAGSYDEDTVLDVVNHVEAASGKEAIIVGTKRAVRNLAPSIQGTDSESDLYSMGYYGKFYGTPVMALPQRHKIGSTDFIYPDNEIHVVASGTKPIKFVYEGESIIKQTDALDNADMTQEYEFYDMYGMGVVMANNDGLGCVQFA